jgi:hypothetical protein
METKFKLFDSEFSLAEAREVICELLEFKMQYRGKMNFGSEIRKVVQVEKSLSRIKTLKNTHQEFFT